MDCCHKIGAEDLTMKAILFLATLLLCPNFAHAQDDEPRSRTELRVSGGWIGFGDEGTLHHGLVGTSVRFSVGGLGIEPELTYMIGPGADRDIVFAPVISWEFGKRKVRPYVLGAAGWLWHRDQFNWGWGYIASAGFGVRTQINSRWSISPEFRLGICPHIEVKAAVGYRF
jgi:hypothetical protein